MYRIWSMQEETMGRLQLGFEASLDDWTIWWGGNLGSSSEHLVSGRVADVVSEVDAARAACKEEAGWVMDVYLLRGPA